MVKFVEIDVKKLIVGGSILVLVLVLSLVFKGYSETPSFCRSCHLMEEGYQAWKNSSHYEVKCVECHTNPGFKGYLEAKIAGLRQASIYFTNSPEPPGTEVFHAEVGNEHCIECHNAINQINGVAKKDLPDRLKEIGLVIGHRAHIEARVKCATCHKADAHDFGEDKLEGKSQTYKLSDIKDLDECPKEDEVICFNCHNGTFYNGKKPSQDCSTCHEL